MSFLAVFIAPVPFLYQRHRLCTHVMLIFILIDVQYLHNDAFSFEKGLIHQNHSLSSHNPIKKPPPSRKIISLSLSLLSISKTLIHFRVFIVFTIYVVNDMFETDLLFLYTNDSCIH